MIRFRRRLPKRSSRYRGWVDSPSCLDAASSGALESVGYVADRQKGSHIVLRHAEPPFRRVTVPDHKELAKGP